MEENHSQSTRKSLMRPSAIRPATRTATGIATRLQRISYLSFLPNYPERRARQPGAEKPHRPGSAVREAHGFAHSRETEGRSWPIKASIRNHNWMFPGHARP